ncbi:hypothetical protein V2J09_002402 [Rumex salicifolius]
MKKNKTDNFGMLKRPVLVKGPLGVVTAMELGFLLLFVALLVYCFVNYLKAGFAGITPAVLAEYGVPMWQAKLESAGLRLGLTGNVCLVFLFFPVTRGSSILAFFGLTSEISIKYHIWLGHMTMVLFTAHGICYVVLWACMDTMSDMLEWDNTGISNVAGELALLAGLVLWAMTFPRIRRKAFELFFYAHYLYIVFVLFFVLHVGISYTGYMLPGFFLFMIDRYLRFLQSRRRVRLLSARVLSSEAFELNFSKTPSLNYSPTSIMFINIPSISRLQWHPFTVTSSSSLEPEKLSVVIKVAGKWTRKLNDMLASSTVDRIEVSTEGPYGPTSTDFLRHDKLVMISGGSGITPFFSIIRELIHLSTSSKCKIPKLYLVCAFKNLPDVALLDLLLPMTGIPTDVLSNIDLQIEAYITRHKEPSKLEDAKLETRTQWFKPNAKDTPISPILGQNGWLCLGLTIASSFVGFLIFIGLLTRFYIYPIDHNTNDIFSSSTRAVLNILIMCICIVVCGGVVVIWNKRKSAMVAKHVVSLEGTTPTVSPLSGFYNADRELESLPQQSLAQSTTVHYGERPDLKRILFDCKGTSIGVLVSGPKNLRHDVAAICGSGLADNLHFESISFSW